MTIEQSIEYISKPTQWQLTNIVVLNQHECNWIAEAKTTHWHPHNRPEEEFVVLVHGRDYVILEQEDIENLGAWCKDFLAERRGSL